MLLSVWYNKVSPNKWEMIFSEQNTAFLSSTFLQIYYSTLFSSISYLEMCGRLFLLPIATGSITSASYFLLCLASEEPADWQYLFFGKGFLIRILLTVPPVPFVFSPWFAVCFFFFSL